MLSLDFFKVLEQFLSTPSARRATRKSGRASNSQKDFYPRPPRGGRRPVIFDVGLCVLISIHALREEGDRMHPELLGGSSMISIHALREEGDLPTKQVVRSAGINFYPRPPRGGRRSWFVSRYSGASISIHALREEGDAHRLSHPQSMRYFYPRPPRGGRHRAEMEKLEAEQFLSTPSARRATSCRVIWVQSLLEFLSTPSARRATVLSVRLFPVSGFLSTPSARRATCTSAVRQTWRRYFYPRPPRGGRLRGAAARTGGSAISIHALREEGDSKNRDKISIFKQIIQHSARI